jgi:MFS family permease
MCNKLLKGKIDGRLVPLGSIGISLGILFFCLASNLYQTPDNVIGLTEFFSSGFVSYLIALSLLGIAIFSGIYIVPLYAIMQHRSENKYLSRIIAANNVLNALFMVASSFVIVGLVALKLTLLQIFLILGIFNIFVFFFIRKIVNKNLKSHA